jgi:hypothetical protein
MKAEDLRIGNILQDRFEHGYVVIKSINYCPDDKEYFFYYQNLLHHKKTIGEGAGVTALYINKPVKITEEWLLKFGFDSTEDPEDVYYTIQFDKDAKYVFEICRKKGRDFYYSEINGFVIQIKYVHQLQNLYWSLTGKELKL